MRFFQLCHLLVQIATLQIKDSIVERMDRFLLYFSMHPAVKFLQSGYCAAYNKIILPFNLFCADLFSSYILQAKRFGDILHYGYLLSNGIDQMKLCFGKKNS